MPKIEEAGRYRATATQAEFGESNTGTPYLYIAFTAEAGNTGAWLYLSDKALPHTTKTLQKAFAFDGKFETAVEQVTGKECDITMEFEEDDKGEDRLKVKWINPVRAEIADKDSFLKNLSAKVARMPKETPKVGAAPARAPAAAVPAKRPAAAPAKKSRAELDEDVPF